MFFYKLGYYDCEDAYHVWLGHEKEYSEKQFNELVVDICPEIVLEQQKRQVEALEKRIQVTDTEVTKRYSREYAQEVRFSRVYEQVVDVLCQKYGFFRANISVTCSVWDEDLLWPEYKKDSDNIFQRIKMACLKKQQQVNEEAQCKAKTQIK